MQNNFIDDVYRAGKKPRLFKKKFLGFLKVL